MTRLSNIGKQFFDANGDPLAGGKLYFYQTGTSTLATTYSDSAETTANANPVILSADGRMPDVFYPGFLKVVLTDADDVVIETRDPVGFSAAVTGIPDGGTTNQVLAKASDTDQDVEWQTVSGGGGDMWTWNHTQQNTSFTATAGVFYTNCDSDISVTLPASPSVGDIVGIKFPNSGATNSFISDGFGSVKIDKQTTTFGFSVGGTGEPDHATLVYSGSDAGWIVWNGKVTVLDS